MSNLMQELGTKVGAEFKSHRLRMDSIDDAVSDFDKSDILNKKNKSLNTKTKTLMDSITAKLNNINEQTGLDDDGNDLLNEGNSVGSND